MSPITKEFTKEQLQQIIETDHVQCGEASSLARIALASLDVEPIYQLWDEGYYDTQKETYDAVLNAVGTGVRGRIVYTAPPAPANAEPVAWLWSHRKHPNEVSLVRPEDDERAEGAHWSGWSCQALYAAPQVPVSVPDVHHSIIAEQLAHVLSNIGATDHQRAVISCAVDRLNKVSQLLQASPSALLVPKMLDYQGAKELYNYLMTEEETNATVNGWNACRAAMLQGAENAESRCTIQAAPALDSSPKIAESRCGNSQVIPECSCRTCRPVTFTDSRFVVCPECGNKRCPHANDHRNACTGSNEPGQEGSAYPAAPQQDVE